MLAPSLLSCALRHRRCVRTHQTPPRVASELLQQPQGEYLAQDGTLHVHATGSISCYPGANGHTPHIEVHIQLHGFGPYTFYNPGRGNVCDGWSCSVVDERYFNLNCGQRGTYTHFARLTGSWIDGVTAHQVEMESVPNKGSYYRAC